MILTPQLKAMIAEEKPQARSAVRVEPQGIGITVVNRALRHMNPAAALIYRLMDGTRTIREIVAEMQRTFPQVPEEELFMDAVMSVREFQFCDMACWRTVQD